MIGLKFGKLTVVSEDKERNKAGYKIYNCSCDCGGTKKTTSTKLKLGHVKSCGCLRKRNILGNKYHFLTVIEETVERDSNHRIKWKCKCDCGKEILTTLAALRVGDRVSCGCKRKRKTYVLRTPRKDVIRYKNLYGQRFGKLVVTSLNRLENKVAYWNCHCDCGNNYIVKTSYLKIGDTRSCGCLRKQYRKSGKTKQEAKELILFSRYKRAAEKRKLEFSLTIEEFSNLINNNCCYCGEKPSNTFKMYSEEFKYSGIDRKDSNRGYISGNCIPSCIVCNRMKMALTEEEFINHVKKIFNYGGIV